MEKTTTTNKTKFIVPRIPDELVYEKIDGKPVYYKGYKDVVNQKKQVEEIMGSSKLQALLVDIILMFLHDNIDRKKYKEWNEDVQVLENLIFSIDQLLKDDDIYNWVYQNE